MSTSVYLRKGTTFTPTDSTKLNVAEVLPAGNYSIFQDQTGKFHLNLIENFEMPTKMYGDILNNADRMFNTFLQRSTSTGVLLAGTKGSGKSLLAKSLAVSAYNNDMPTIVINGPWRGDDFNKFIQDISQPCVIIFDEFEKVYDRDEQEELLTLLDGVFTSKKLFIFTCNDIYRIDKHMLNRPGRIYYKIIFKGLDVNFIKEYCQENLKNSSYIDKIVRISALFNDFNFDMLKAIVEEMNRYNESPDEVLKLLNVSPDQEQSEESFSIVSLIIKNESIALDKLYEDSWYGNPLGEHIEIGYEPTSSDSIGNSISGNIWVTFTPCDIVKIDPISNTFQFVNDRQEVLVIIRKPKKFTNFYDAV